jgi:hypothetical protein
VPSSAILGDYVPLTHVGKDPSHERFPITILPPQSDLLGRDQRALNEVASAWRMNREDLATQEIAKFLERRHRVSHILQPGLELMIANV